MPFAETVAEFFDKTDGFAEDVTISGGVGVVTGIIRDDYEEEMDQEGTDPTFTCATGDVGAVTQGMTLTRTTPATIYKIRDRMPDGSMPGGGVTILILEAP